MSGSKPNVSDMTRWTELYRQCRRGSLNDQRSRHERMDTAVKLVRARLRGRGERPGRAGGDGARIPRRGGAGVRHAVVVGKRHLVAWLDRERLRRKGEPRDAEARGARAGRRGRCPATGAAAGAGGAAGPAVGAGIGAAMARTAAGWTT